jgi:hypothetical protein
MPLIFPNVGNLSSAINRNAPPISDKVNDRQPMSERRPSDDLAELRGMMILTGRSVSGLGELAIPPIPGSTLNKAWNRLTAGIAKRAIPRTMEKLRRGLRAKGYEDTDWLKAGIDLRTLTIALIAATKVAEAIRPETAPSAATVMKRIIDRLALRPDLSDEAAEAVAEALAEDLRVEISRK